MFSEFDCHYVPLGLLSYKSTPTKECPECNGEGRREYEVMEYGGLPGAYSPFKDVMLECQRCNGEGEIIIEEEDYCDE